MKHSFRFKITFFMVATIALTIILCWFLNRTFLEDFYEYSKKRLISEIYTEINTNITVVDEDVLTDEQKAYLDKIQVSENVKIYLFQEVELNSSFGKMYFTYFVYPEQENISHRDSQGMMGKREYYRIYESVQEYTFPNLFSGLISKVKTLEENDRYQIMTQYDVSMESDFMDLYGTLDCGYKVFVRSGLESIQEAVGISNKFLFLLGSAVVIISTLIAYIFSRRFTKPVLELSGIAQSMSELNFNVKYKVTSKDEIGLLGHSINTLSEKLEQNISELKRANIELQSDIEKKMQIDEIRKDFLSNVTHELKTPIALIQGYAEGLKDNITEDEESKNYYCEVIIDEAVKMNKMVKKLLSLNQIEFGNVQMDIARFDLIALISSVINSTSILFKQKEITVVFNYTEALYVWADEYMIEEVLTNYISNAVNHADGDRIIKISLEQQEQTVRISVFNTGEPIPEEDIENVWVKFYKVDKARTREYGGSGIGLSIVKAIMESHNRTFGVVNHEDGVEFWFELDTFEH